MKPHFLDKSSISFYRVSILVLLLLVSHFSVAQSVEIIPVQYRPAENIAEQIKDLYPEQQVHVSGRNQQLTVRAEAHTLEEIKTLIISLDIPLRQFLISMSNDANSNTRNQHWGVSGTISNTESSSSNSNNIVITTHNKTYQTRGGGSQSIKVLEGYSAYLNAGQKKPVQTRRFINGQWVNTIEYIDLTSGFYVVPRLVGMNQVELKVHSQRNEASKQHHQEINTATVDTVQIVRLGEWVSIGGTYSDTGNNQSGISYSTKQQRVDKQRLMIKVDLLPE